MNDVGAAAQPKTDHVATHSGKVHSDDARTGVEWTGALNEANAEKISGFFRRWKPSAGANSDCVSDAELIEIAKLTDRNSWPKHVQSCSRCENVIQLLNRADMKIPIDVFLSRTSREVRQAKGKQSFSSYVWAFYNISAPRYAVVYLVVFLFLGVAGIWIYQKRSETSPPYAASLKEDDYWKTTEWIRARTAIADESSLSPDQKLAKLRELQGDYGVIEGKLIAIQRSNTLGPSEKAELAQLVTTYNSQVKLLTSKSETKAVSEGADPVLVIQASTDSDIVSKVSVSILSSKSDQINQKERDLETAKAVMQASKELDFTSINNKEVEVQDLVPNRSEGERKAIQERLTDLKNTDGIAVKLNEVSRYRDTSSPMLKDTSRPIEGSAKRRKE
jgi:hypothetical protein